MVSRSTAPAVHPSRLVALCCFVVGATIVVQFAVVDRPEVTGLATLQLVGGLFLLCSSVYGLVRYEENPIVTEYGPTTYLLVAGCAVWAIASLLQLLTL